MSQSLTAVAGLLAWPQQRVRVSFECAPSGVQHHSFEGPLLHDVLTDAGPGFDPARRKDRLRFLIAVTGADGHHALLTWAEIDPDFGRAPVLPQDRCGARHISGITAITVDRQYAGGR